MRRLAGIATSPGVGIGPVKILKASSAASPHADRSHDQHQRFHEALKLAGEQISALRDRMAVTSPEEAEIFDAHLLLLEDPMLLDAVDSRIATRQLSAEEAVNETIAELSALFEALQDEYIRGRAADIQDIGARICRNLSGEPPDATSGGVWVATEFLPSQVAAAHAAGALALACDGGTLNSHAAILARSLGIPAVFALKGLSSQATEGEPVIVDGAAGIVLLEADSALQAKYEQQADTAAPEEALRALRGQIDPATIHLKANISSIAEAEAARAAGADGIGVVRTEFLFADRTEAPTEEEQFRIYAAMARAVDGKPMAIRTLDAGSDKPLAYLNLPREENPALGLRGLRISLAMPEVFKTQLRAILRAADFGKVQILLPMVTHPGEIDQARALLKEAIGELRESGIHPAKVALGVMIEVPSAALNAEAFAEKADFLSIGTNDLVQYTLAADRVNASVAHLYNEMDPSVLELIRRVADAGRKFSRPVSVCGEMAADLRALPALLQAGIREFSVTPTSLPRLRTAIRGADSLSPRGRGQG